MGETGCGKTRLIRYMCQLQSILTVDPDKVDAGPPRQTFFIMKVSTYFIILLPIIDILCTNWLCVMIKFVVCIPGTWWYHRK